MFRLWSRDQNRRIDQDVEAPEFLASCDVLRGLSGEALMEIAREIDALHVGKLAFRMRAEMCAVRVDGM
jgi:hypothetical protein